MNTPVKPRSRARASSEQATDVPVVFGISDDLARVIALRSLYRLEGRGLHAEVPHGFGGWPGPRVAS